MLRQNIIITERCQSLRQLGRNALRGKWRNGIMTMIVFILCMTLPVLIFNQLFGMNLANYLTTEGYTYNMDAELYQQMYNALPQMSILSSVWVLLISGPMTLGLMIYFLASFRGHNVMVKDVFLGFERFGKALGLFLFQSLFIFLWTLLFIVPGIIASIRYSQAFFVLADDPNKSIRECMNESKFMMKGNKGKYFLLSLSFIGWMILASVPGSILTSIADTLNAGPAMLIVISTIASLLMAPVYAYMYSTFAGFYEILAGHLIKETTPAPLSVDQIEADAPPEKIEEVIEAVESEALEAAGSEEPEMPEEPEEIVDAEILPEPLEEEDKYND